MAQSVQEANDLFMKNSLIRNYFMANFPITAAGQVIDIELDSIPGWATHIDLMVYADLLITVGAGGAAPSISPFAPFNLFSDCQVSLGGGPFLRANPYFYFLRELATHRSWIPGNSYPLTPTYGTSLVYNVPMVNAPAGAATDNYWRFPIRIPLQPHPLSAMGLLPLGTASVKAKVRLTVTPSLYGTDQYVSPLYGGTNVTSVVIGITQNSWVSPNIMFRTTPATKADVPTPTAGYVLNVQERAINFTSAGALTPVKFPDPFKYLRLWFIVIDGTGAPNTSAVTNFELDLTPGYPQFNWSTPQSLMQYYNYIQRKFETNLPVGVFVHDLYAGADPYLPNDTQMIDGTVFQTLQAQIAVAAGTNVGSPARIISYAEALSPVAF